MNDAELAKRLRQAVNNQTESPYLEAKIRQSIQSYEASRSARWNWARPLTAVAAAMVICFGGWIAYELGHLRVTASSQEAYIRTISHKVSGILQIGLGDHVHCTVFRKFPKQPPTPEAMIATLGPEYAGLLPAVKERIPDNIRIIMAHRCSYHGRKFVHLALRDDSNLISLVITRKGSGETFEKDQLAPALSESGIPIYEGGVQRFAIAGFETPDHLVYLVSDLNPQQNLEMLLAIGPAIRGLLVTSAS